MTKIDRNAPCPCGSGKKYKKCCEGSKVARRSPKLNQFLTGIVFLAVIGAVSWYYYGLGSTDDGVVANEPVVKLSTPGPKAAPVKLQRMDGPPPGYKPDQQVDTLNAPPVYSGQEPPMYPGAEPIPGMRKKDLKELPPGLQKDIEKIAAEEGQKKQEVYPLTDQSGQPVKDSTK